MSPPRRLVAAALAGGLGLSCSTGPAPSQALVERRAAYASEDVGAQAFLYGDFSGLSSQTLETQAVPWKLACTALLLYRNPGDVPFTEAGALQLVQRYGLFVPKRMANWPERTSAPTPRRPLGVVTGQLSQGPGFNVEVANLGCAACHASRGFDAAGRPTDEAWLGVPNGSFDAEAWGRDLFGALLETSRLSGPEVIAEVRRAFPGLSDDEERGLRTLYLPRLKQRVEALEEQGAFVDFHRGLPGLPDGLASLEWMLGVQTTGEPPRAPASIPALFSNTRPLGWWDGRFSAGKGVAAPPAAPCAVAMMGIPAEAVAPQAASLAAAVRAVARARTPPFPGKVDELLVRDGERAFKASCAECHGTYDGSTRPARPKQPPGEEARAVGTDGLRLERAPGALVRAWNGSPARAAAAARDASGYLAPGLSGVWASAPYLHNGSVPSLAALLDPSLRPARFLVGGHALDFTAVGIAHAAGDPTRYPQDVTPWSTPALYDTAEPGQGRDGHVAQVQSLSAADRRALLEYLKTL